MATFGEIIYSVSDLLKLSADDSFYTEEHILFLASKMRSLLIERKYRGSRNSVYKEMPDENKQRICLNLEPAADLEDTCTGNWQRSIETIPSLVNGTGMSVYPINNLIGSNITFIPAVRMPYVGYNRWLKNILYCSKASNGHMYFHSDNPQFMLLDKIEAEGIFEDPVAAAGLSCEDNASDEPCDIMDKEFPLEDALVMSCIEMVVQELIGSRYAPEDNRNNAKDDFGGGNVGSNRTNTPAENSLYAYRNQKADKEEE